MCTNFSLFSTGKSNDYTITARTMDFAPDLHTELRVQKRGQSFPDLALSPVKHPLKWVNQYGYVGMQGKLGVMYAISDGINEKGLSVASLWLPDSVYPNDASASSSSPALYNICFCEWVLGNFASVAELKAGLNKVTVINISELDPKARVLLHYAVTDSTGANMIVEFTNGEMQTYDSDNGVMTNAPPYPYQVTNLNSYINLSLKNNPQEIWGQELNGSGCLGMPGDYTPPSRFVKAYMLQQSVQYYTPTNIQEAIGLCARILQNFAIPMGAVVMDDNSGMDYTQWCAIRDHKNLVYYYLTQFNNNLFSVDLKQIDFSQTATKSTPIEQQSWVTDITAKMC